MRFDLRQGANTPSRFDARLQLDARSPALWLFSAPQPRRPRERGARDWTMTGVFENLSSPDMHSNQITSSSYHSLHKSQESPTLPVSTATDSNYYNSQQPGHCAGSPFGQLGSYQYHSSGAANTVPYSAKSYELGFSSPYGAYSSYGPNSSPTPADTGK